MEKYISEDYCSEEISGLLQDKGYIGSTNTYLNKDGFRVKEITLQSAMKWLREKHIVITPEVETFYADGSVSSWAYHIWCDDNYEEDQNAFSSYKEACEEAILYCLKNLI